MGLIGQEIRRVLFGSQDVYADAGPSDNGYPHTHLSEALVERVIGERQPQYWVEVGSMLGGSALLVARVAERLGCELDIVCVDPFTGDVNMWAWEQDLVRQGKWRFLGLVNGAPTIRQRFLANVKDAGFEGVITPLPATGIVGMNVLERVSNYRPDVVYVDSAHEEDETFLELSTAWDFLVKGGLLMGDDLDWPAVRNDVYKFAGSVGAQVEVVGNQWLVGK
jgi:predicted O-methyltransferase YrrM